VLQASHKLRDGFALGFSDAVATFGLLLIIAGGIRYRAAVPVLVGLYITAAYWFTASTSFANPAVTIARSLSDTFAGIAPSSAPGFIAAQLIGGFLAWLICGWLFAPAIGAGRAAPCVVGGKPIQAPHDAHRHGKHNDIKDGHRPISSHATLRQKKKGSPKAALELFSSGEERNHMPEPWILAFQPASTAFTATSGSGV